MIRRTVLGSPAGGGARFLNTTAIPVTVWPQAPGASLPTRGTARIQPKPPIEFPVDVFTTHDEAVIRAALPGVDPEHIEVSVYRDLVTISAQLPAMPTAGAESITWLVSEIGRGSFSRTLRLPFQIDEQQVEAQFANGMLQLVLPKVEAERPHRISVQVRPELNYELGAGQSENETFAAD